jgi:hypothetical protein
MIKHLFSTIGEEMSKTNARTLYNLLSKIIVKEGFLTMLEKSLAFQSLVSVILKYPEMLKLYKKDPLELMDDAFNEFNNCSDSEADKSKEVYANWIKCLNKLKFLFNNNSKGFVIVKMSERIESLVNRYGIDDDHHSMNIFICLDWIEYLSDYSKLPFNLMYIVVILSYANDLKIKDKANFILQPLMKQIDDETLVKEKVSDREEDKVMEEGESGNDDTFMRSMFIKKASQYNI